MNGEPGVVVMHCSDPRFQLPFQDFLRGELGLKSYSLIAVPGGPQFLTLAEYLPKFAWAGWRWVKFLMDLGSQQRVILIAHEDCRWYQDQRFWQEGPNLREKQVRDLKQVRAGIQERFGNLKVELYYARLRDKQVAFEAL